MKLILSIQLTPPALGRAECFSLTSFLVSQNVRVGHGLPRCDVSRCQQSGTLTSRPPRHTLLWCDLQNCGNPLDPVVVLLPGTFISTVQLQSFGLPEGSVYACRSLHILRKACFIAADRDTIRSGFPGTVPLLWVLTLEGAVTNNFTTRVNIKTFYILPLDCTCVFCMDLRTNSECFAMQH